MDLPIEIRAGSRALTQIQEQGLRPQDIHSVYGASGAAKWLAIAGLDAAIFSSWLPQSSQSISLFGTSIGAMKLAAAVQSDPASTLMALAKAYIAQTYEGRPTAKEIAEQSAGILDVAFANGGDRVLIEHPRYRYHCGAVHCKSRLSGKSTISQVNSMLILAAQCLKSRNALADALDRVIFCAGRIPDSGSAATISGADCFQSLLVELTEANIRDAILSSGSIPVYMDSVDLQLPTLRPGSQAYEQEALCLRDGGLLDYHPLPDNLDRRREEGLILYPHFYADLKETWFDKFYPWRTVKRTRLEDVVLIAPSPSYLKTLSLGRIPDRADFSRFSGKDQERIDLWTDALNRSLELGESWLSVCETQNWSMVKPL